MPTKSICILLPNDRYTTVYLELSIPAYREILLSIVADSHNLFHKSHAKYTNSGTVHFYTVMPDTFSSTGLIFDQYPLVLYLI